MNWGWNPTTLSAVGTMLATLIATVAVLLAVIEQRIRRQEHVSAQALKVSAFPGPNDGIITVPAADDETIEHGWKHEIVVHNSSNQPITGVTPIVRWFAKSSPALPERAWTHWSYSVQFHEMADLNPLYTLPPGESVVITGNSGPDSAKRAINNGWHPCLSVEFFDSNFRTWNRECTAGAPLVLRRSTGGAGGNGSSSL